MNNFKKQTLEMLSLMKEAAELEVIPRFGKCKGTIKLDIPNFKDLVTEADTSASEYILNKVRPSFPGSYSEEHKYEDRFDHDLIWQIDPVDGTQEFVEGYGKGYTMLAALLKRDENGLHQPILGIIYMPETKESWHTEGECVIYQNSNGQSFKLSPHINKDLIGYQRKVDPHPKLNLCYKDIHKGLNIPYHIVHSGGSGTSISDLLMGNINLIVMNNNLNKDWDTGMAEPMIQALGGFICDYDGNPLYYNQKNRPGYDEPFHHRGVVMSIQYKKEEILPFLRKDLFVDRLK